MCGMDNCLGPSHVYQSIVEMPIVQRPEDRGSFCESCSSRQWEAVV